MTRTYDYLTYEWRSGAVCVHGWDTYPDSSVLAGQPRKRYLASFDTAEEAEAAYPEASPTSLWTQPTVSLLHLSDGPDY